MFWRKKEKKVETNPFEANSQPSTPAPSYSPPQETYRHNEAEQRNQLMSGARDGQIRQQDDHESEYTSRRSQRRNQPSRYDDSYQDNEEEEDEEVQVNGMKHQIRNLKQESLASTRLAIQKMSETEATAGNTMNMLGQQSTQLANIDRNLDLSKAYSDRASSQADELKKVNRSIFIPVVSNPFTKKDKERRELENRQRDHNEHMQERDNIRKFEYESHARIEQTHRMNENTGRAGRRGRNEADRNRYQFEADEEDDRIEDELDENLDLLAGMTGRLKNLAMSMGDELDSQNNQLNTTLKRVEPVRNQLASTTDRLNKIR
ncbi:hypothetical protein BDB01DRAFT_151278 [Pilobolus umbonatus]|nr:hypothetical protein BDB01DRAFT_151278 [Pilobolus umbonatus]